MKPGNHPGHYTSRRVLLHGAASERDPFTTLRSGGIANASELLADEARTFALHNTMQALASEMVDQVPRA